MYALAKIIHETRFNIHSIRVFNGTFTSSKIPIIDWYSCINTTIQLYLFDDIVHINQFKNDFYEQYQLSLDDAVMLHLDWIRYLRSPKYNPFIIQSKLSEIDPDIFMNSPLII